MANGSVKRRHRRLRLRRTHGSSCHWCERRMVFEPAFWKHRRFATVEHLVALADGGNFHDDNLRLACRECNEKRGKEAEHQRRRLRHST